MKKLTDIEMFHAGYTNDGRNIPFERVKDIAESTLGLAGREANGMGGGVAVCAPQPFIMGTGRR